MKILVFYHSVYKKEPETHTVTSRDEATAYAKKIHAKQANTALFLQDGDNFFRWLGGKWKPSEGPKLQKKETHMQMKEVLAATYVSISREELEAWLTSLHFPKRWTRVPNRAGIYLIPLSEVVAIKLSSSIGSQDNALDVGKASMQLSLISTVTGQTLNKKAQGQSHFKRTTNWKTTWAEGIERMKQAYVKAKGFYDSIAKISDRDQYKFDTLAEIEAIVGWDQMEILVDFHKKVQQGTILSDRQREALEKIKDRGGVRPVPSKAPVEPHPSRNTWSLSGGASGEETYLFTVKSPYQVLVQYHDADSGPENHPSEDMTSDEAAAMWTKMVESGNWNPHTNAPPPFLPKKAPPPPPAPRAVSLPPETEELLARARKLWDLANRNGDTWLKDFTANVGQRLKSGLPITDKQRETLERNLTKFRLASKITERYLSQ